MLGSGGVFVQSEKFVESHGGRIGDIAIYGQESNYTTWRRTALARALVNGQPTEPYYIRTEKVELPTGFLQRDIRMTRARYSRPRELVQAALMSH